MEKLKLVVNSVRLHRKKDLDYVIGVTMKNPEDDPAGKDEWLSFYVPKADYEKYKLGQVVEVTVKPAL